MKLRDAKTRAYDLEKIRDSIETHIHHLLALRSSKSNVAGRLNKIGRLLESLPLATDEFAVANRRLRNAKRYFRAGECGAAHYELRLLRGGLD